MASYDAERSLVERLRKQTEVIDHLQKERAILSGLLVEISGVVQNGKQGTPASDKVERISKILEKR